MDSKQENLKSNKEIVDELTKDLENSCIKTDENSIPKDSNANESVEGGSLTDDPWESIGKDPDKKADDANLPTDFVDEELLKDRELNLSEEEKETLKNEAEKLKNEGNDFFKSGEYLKAITVYTQGLQTCPLAYSKERSILFANRAAAKTKSLDKDSAISDCTKAIELNPSYVKAYIRRAQLYEETDKLDEALEDFKKVLTFDASHTEANYAVRRLPPKITERNEKLKTEMLGKLKDLGNMVLKPFGLSTNNFQLQEDPKSGGYSVKFQQNPS